jgi:predicted dehydrogenase
MIETMNSEARATVAVIGCGWAGRRHAQAFEQCGARVRWAVDIDSTRAEALMQRSEQPHIAREAHVTTDYQTALDDPEVDIVSIALPHNLHAPVAVQAAKARKHILCEKPIATTLEEADQMIAAAERAGVTLMVAENARFTALFRKVRKLLHGGVIGRPALIQITRQAYLRRSFLQDRPWFLDAEAAGGGIMMAGGVHDFETMHMLIGDIESVYARRAPQRFMEMEGDDTSIATVQFRNGVVGTLVESFIMKSLMTAAGPEIHTLRIDGSLGSLWVEDGHTIHLFSEREDYLLGQSLIGHKIYVPPQDTFVLEVEHLLACLQMGKEPITSGRRQRKPLAVVLAAYRSMETGQPVTVEP